MTDSECSMIIKRIGNLHVNYKAAERLEYKEDINNSQKDLSDAEKSRVRLILSFIISESVVKAGKDD